MNPPPLCARIFRLQGRISPQPSHGGSFAEGDPLWLRVRY